jgi:hypothetical protein
MKAASLPPTIWMSSDQRVGSCRKVGSGSVLFDKSQSEHNESALPQFADMRAQGHKQTRLASPILKGDATGRSSGFTSVHKETG